MRRSRTTLLLRVTNAGAAADSAASVQGDTFAVMRIPAADVFDPEALSALKNALAGNGLPDFFHYLVSLDY